ncbi:hypothetical protein ADEAN_000115000 [Angomonas deanei]|uniref:Uncharacterized protein n=1 Tax=Angomonas deanei TaxID=59799 RepID=A0A7G2C4N3_9TRYP|nr:hypothetical protein ADEAN_000115000 [Angomonas deanei]
MVNITGIVFLSIIGFLILLIIVFSVYSCVVSDDCCCCRASSEEPRPSTDLTAEQTAMDIRNILQPNAYYNHFNSEAGPPVTFTYVSRPSLSGTAAVSPGEGTVVLPARVIAIDQRRGSQGC